MDTSVDALASKTLCEVCTASLPGLHRLLHPDPSASKTPDPVSLSRISELQTKQTTCALCRLVQHALAQSWPDVPLWSKSSISMFAPERDTRAVLVSAAPVAEALTDGLPRDAPRCLHVEVVLDEAPPIADDVGPSGGVTQTRDMAGFKMGGRERLFQPEIRLLQQQQAPEAEAERKGSDVGLAREIGPTCSSERLVGWYRGCVDNPAHDENCVATRIVSDEAFESPRGQPAPSPRLPPGTRLIDVVAMKLVPAGERHDIEYAALSYVWGEVQLDGLNTTLGNVADREVDGSVASVDLPRTISDAVDLTRDLGIPYLWVDALCIVQDAPYVEKAIQIDAMDKVYGLASLVVVAAAGADSEAGLVGFRNTPREQVTRDVGCSNQKDLGQLVADVQGLRLAVSPPPLQHLLAAAKWNTRGWTYQELLFARRVMVFTSTQVYFLCGSMSFSEDLVLEPAGAVTAMWQLLTQQGPAATIRHAVPDAAFQLKSLVGVSSGWTTYVNAAESFSPRVLRDPRDVLRALAGVLGNLHRTTRNRFVAGVSVGLLHDALLWVPVVGHMDYGTLERTEVSVAAGASRFGWRTGGQWLPTWSWAEWNGPVQYGVMPPGKSLVKEFKVAFTSPAFGHDYMQSPDEKPLDDTDEETDEEQEEDHDDDPALAPAKPNFFRRLFRMRPESRLRELQREAAQKRRTIITLQRQQEHLQRLQRRYDRLAARVIHLHAHLLGHPLAEPQTDRPMEGIVYPGKRLRLHGEDPADGASAEALRAGSPLVTDSDYDSLAGAVRSARLKGALEEEEEDAEEVVPLPPIYSHCCILFFTAEVATVQIACVLDDLGGRADGVLDHEGRYIGVALLDQPGTPAKRIEQSFQWVQVVALSRSHLPTKYFKQGAFSQLAGVVHGEETEWIGLLILGRPRVPSQDEEQTGDEARDQAGEEGKKVKEATMYVRIGVAQVVKKAWELWVDKKEEDMILR